MRRFGAIFLLCAALLLAGEAKPASALPQVILSVAENWEFFAGFKGYGEYLLHDTERLDKGCMGVILIDPLGYVFKMIFDARTQEVIHREGLVFEKKRRETMKSESIEIPDAVKLGKATARYVK